MPGHEAGVTIGLREIYDKVQEVAVGVQRLSDRVESLEKKSEASAEALQTAKAAKETADELKENQRWLWRAFVGALIVGAVTLWLKN